MTVLKLPAAAWERTARLFAWHPEWWVVATAAAAWVAVLSQPHGARPTVAHDHGSVVVGHATVAPLSIGLMLVAMMTPLVVPLARWLAVASLRRRRTCSQALFLIGYVAVWFVAATVITEIGDMATKVASRTLVIVVVCTAAFVWQFTSMKRRVVRRCAATRPIAANGWRADLGCVAFGFAAGRSCVSACGFLMAVLAVIDHHPVAMGALFLVQMNERMASTYVPTRGAVVVLVLGASAIGVAI